MYDHISLKVTDVEKSLKFYEAALAPLGYQASIFDENGEKSAGFGLGKMIKLWISRGEKPSSGLHIAFSADDHKTVEAFYEAAMAAGGRDNGGPGFRPNYHESYYAAFAFDPDGNNIEVVSHFPGKAEDQFAGE